MSSESEVIIYIISVDVCEEKKECRVMTKFIYSIDTKPPQLLHCVTAIRSGVISLETLLGLIKIIVYIWKA